MNRYESMPLNRKAIKMPVSPKDFPGAIERSVMQRLNLASGLAPKKLGAGWRVVAKLLTKGWIEQSDDGYRLTPAGSEAFKRPIPM